MQQWPITNRTDAGLRSPSIHSSMLATHGHQSDDDLVPETTRANTNNYKSARSSLDILTSLTAPTDINKHVNSESFYYTNLLF